MEDPIVKFNRWWQESLRETPLQRKSAVCVSTVTAQGFPSGRFVDLKAADAKGFVFCTALDSHKGKEIAANPKVALTIWWDHVGYQVRILGEATALSSDAADTFWETRSRDAQLSTLGFQQSRPLESQEGMAEQWATIRAETPSGKIQRPESWGGFSVRPASIEFLTFQENRLHLRELFEARGGIWRQSLLQP